MLAQLLLTSLLAAGASGLPRLAPLEPAPAGAAPLILRSRFPPSGAAPLLQLEGEKFRGSRDLACFYQRRSFALAWSDGGRLRPAADELVAALAAAGDDGLRPESYRPAALGRLAIAVRGQPEPGALAELDLLLSDAFLTFGAHLRNGKVNPRKIYSDCALGEESVDLAAILESALGEGNVRAALAALAPPHRAYGLLREALARYRRLAALGDAAGAVPAGPALRLGDRGERVALLRSRLALAAEADGGEPLPPSATPDLLDPPLELALRGFQVRHSLEADGVAGKATLRELNLGPEDHVRQLEVNLERWRWLPHDLGPRHIRVNIAAFRLEAVDGGWTVLTMAAIVGKPFTRTPMFSSSLSAVLLNPSWYVPRKIAVDEILPKAAKDPSYLRREGFEVLAGSRLRQRPGPKNALGRIKLDFPNRFGVYLHDTPAPALFSRTLRAFSHGCIRIEKPLDLALWVLRGDPAWTAETLRAAIETGRERRVGLTPDQAVAVHVAYWTAWIDEAGVLRLGRDVYGRDAEIARLLAVTRPGR